MLIESALDIIPQPKEVIWGDGSFTLNAQTDILLLPDSGEAEHFSARTLQQEIREATGLNLRILKTARPSRRKNVVLLFSDAEAAQSYWGDALAQMEAPSDKGDQAYIVAVAPQAVIAGGRGAAAMHYAVQTLRQLVRTRHCTLPAFHLTDWPSLPYRGLMLDVSRGKVPTVETLKLIVEQLSLVKANVLQLYTEHTFYFPHHPHIGEGCGSLTGDDILALDAHARQWHVELMPNLQSFGHCEHILSLPEYQKLAESPAARWSLCPLDEQTYEFLNDLYTDLLPAFSSPTFNVDCDETWDLGIGRSAQAGEGVKNGRVYLQHILRLRELAGRYGRRIQMWGDILLHHPELVAELPDDVTLLDWHYEANPDYPSVRLFAESGRRFWVCPGTSSWNTLFPRIENANANIRTLALLGAQYGAEGLLNTDWGDHGHYQPLGQCWYGYAYGAEQAWSGGETEDGAFDSRFGPLFFGPGGQEVVAAMRALAHLNTLPGMPRPNASNSIFMLLDEPLLGPVTEQVPTMTLEEITRTCEQAENDLRAALPSSRDPLSIEEMLYSTRMMAFAARKTMACQTVRHDLSALAEGQGEPRDDLQRAITSFRDLDSRLAELTEVFRHLWLCRARHAEMRITLDHFAQLRARFSAAGEWLRERLAQAATGHQPAYDLNDYRQCVGRYEILGDRFHRRMRESGVWS